jgi:hypothetical protein
MVVHVTLDNMQDANNDPYIAKAVFSLPTNPLSWRNEKFGLTRFVKRYKEIPRVGLKVAVVTTPEGFFRVLL